MYKSLSEKVMVGDCPYCGGDSFIYKHVSEMFLCHHCKRHMPRDKMKESESQSFKLDVNFDNILKFCIPLNDLPQTHDCVKYVRSRKIENTSDLFFTENFDKIASITGNKIGNKPRLILPFFDEEGEIFGMQGRTLDGSEPRYVTLMFKKDKSKIFGLNRVKTEERFFVTEGPIDSLFLENSCAMAGTDGLDGKYKPNAVIVLDNEPRNKQVVMKYKKYIEQGYSIVVWPDNIKQKDINDMVLDGINIQGLVEENVFSGMTAKMKFNSWKKI